MIRRALAVFILLAPVASRAADDPAMARALRVLASIP